MASFSFASPSPTSLQLRFGCRCRQSSPPFLLVRFRPHRRRFSFCFTAGPDDGVSGVAGQSLDNANGSPDSFAGWSDEGIDGDESKSKGFSGGIVGMGLAGVLFAAGVTFATLSLTNRTTSRTKPEMKQLTMAQEAQISLNDAVPKDHHFGDSTMSILQTESNMNFDKKGKENNILPSADMKENAFERTRNIQESETQLLENFNPADKSLDIIGATSIHDGIQRTQNLSVDPVSLEFSNKPSESQGDTTIKSSDVSSLKDMNLAKIYDPMTSISSHNMIISNINTHADLTSASVKKVGSSDKIDSDSEFIDAKVTAVSTSLVQTSKENLQHPSEPCTNHPLAHGVQGNDTERILEFDSSVSEELILPLQSMSAPEGQNINENGMDMAYSASESSEANIKEPDEKLISEPDSSPLFDSILPKKNFTHSGIPAPSLVSAAIQVAPEKVLVSPVVDQVQVQALAALQVLKVIEADVQPGDLCTRREYARWLVSASSILSRNPASKVYPAMYIENVTELAFDDVTPNDPDFPYIQGLAEAGLISSKVSVSGGSENGQQDNTFFFPNSPVSRQDLVSWKMALERRELPEVDKNYFFGCTGYIDADKINPDAWPALLADLSSGEQSITALAFGFTRLFQPDKPVTKAQAAIALATGDAAEVVLEELARIETESIAETAVNTHNALVADVKRDLNSSFNEELAKEREKIETLEKLAEEATRELERLRKQREEENIDLIRGRATVESEMEVLSRLRQEVEEQLQSVMSSKMEMAFERERINKLREEVETENHVIAKLQYELEVERKALSMARAWAEDEAKRAREHARALEVARARWENQGIKVVVDGDLESDASFEPTWVTARERSQTVEAIDRGEKLVKKLKDMVAEIKLKSSAVIQSITKKIDAYTASLKQQALEASSHVTDHKNALISKAKTTVIGLQEGASEFSSTIGNRAKKVVDVCKESMDKITHRFKT